MSFRRCLIVCASPADGDVTETLSTLRFASRAKRVKNVAKIHATIEPGMLENNDSFAHELQAHLDEEKRNLEAAREKSEQVAANAIALALRLGFKQVCIAIPPMSSLLCVAIPLMSSLPRVAIPLLTSRASV